MKAHELAKMLLASEDKELSISVDISKNEDDSGRRIFIYDIFGVNSQENPCILCYSDLIDNYGKDVTGS